MLKKKKEEGIFKKRDGFCDCCGENVTFTSKYSWLRDHYICSNCGSIPRERHISYVIKNVVPGWRDFSIHESSPARRGASEMLRTGAKDYFASHYYPQLADDKVGDYWNIDIQQQNFPDKKFDLVVTQDVFEHIPYPEKAAREISRTLKDGGYFISTIPLVNKFEKTERWARLDGSEIKFLYEPEYHGNPIDEEGGAPVFWHYGYDVAADLLEWAGFQTIIVSGILQDRGIEGEYTEVVVCRKK